MSHFILIASDVHRNMLSCPSGYEVATHRIKERLWGLHKRTRNIKRIKVNDIVLIYAAGRRDNGRTFVGTAAIKKISQYSTSEKNRYTREEIPSSPIEVFLHLTEVRCFKKPISIYKIKEKVEFIKNPNAKRWGVILQGGSLSITEKDFKKIIKAEETD
jgi:hypothetical protein